MFAGKSRPIPSKAALDALYQLAYISSGTAVGVAALCAEERRRRTQVVQKIAENAKRIRQSPRYHHATAVAAQELEEYTVGGTDWVSEWQYGPTVNEGRRRPHEDHVARGSELPSVVEGAYAQTQGGPDGRVVSTSRHRRRTSHAGAVPTHPTNKMTTTSADAASARHHRRSLGLPNGFLKQSKAQELKASANRSVLVHKDRGPQDTSRPGSVNTTERKLDLQAVTTSSPTASSQMFSDLIRTHGPFRTHGAWHHALALQKHKDRAMLPDLSVVSQNDLTRDVDRFFTTVQVSEVDATALHVADQLLRASLAFGTLEDVRSLYLWKVSQNLFTERDAQASCDLAWSLALRSHHEHLLDFYSNVFCHPCFSESGVRLASELMMPVLAEACGWNVNATPTDLAKAVLTPVLKATTRDELSEVMAERCRALVQESKLTHATGLLLSLQEFCDGTEEHTNSLRMTLNATLDAGAISDCAKLLWLAKGLLPSVEFAERCDAFLQACDERSAYGLIVDFFVTYRKSRRPDNLSAFHLGLSQKSYEILAFACIHGGRTPAARRRFFSRAYAKVPPKMRGRINHTRSCLRIMDLWESTHDLSKVLTFAHDTLPWIEAHGTADEVRSWRLATFEIYIKADRADLARDALLKLQKAGSSQMESVSLASLLLAKKGAWEALERLLTIAEEADEFALDIDAAARFNDTLRLYTNEHTAVESWQFVTRAIDKLGFLPDHITTEVMLKAFISTNNIRMVPKWLRYVHTLGREFELTAKVASRLLTLFYRNNRPSHAIMMWLCRNLTVSAPSLAGPHFVNVIKDSIGFDIRKAGAGLIWRRSVGRARLAALSDSTGALPAPGYSWNGQLYFEHPSKTGPAMENVNVTCAEPLQASAQAVGLSPNAEAAAELRPSVIATSEDSAEKQNAADLEESHTSSHQTAKLSDRPKAADDFATDMTLALSLGRYERVLDLYHSSLNTVGLPISPLALEIALEACLRQNRGNSTAAEALLSSAKAAGMNITCAMGPMLIHKMYHLKASDKKDVNNLRLSVIDYYRMNDEHAWPVKHNVGIQAANLLIDGGKPHHGINILDAIFHSKWAAKRPLDIVAMTVFFKGYAAVQSFDGLKWVVNTVLEQNMRIDAKFLQTLKTVSKDFARDLSIEAFRRRDSTYRGTMSAPSLWIKLCQGRRARQKHENMVIGRELVACLAKCANEQSQPEIDATSRHALENELFGKRMKPVEAALGTDEIPAPGDGRRARGWESYKLRTARAVRADPALGLRRPRGRTNTSYSRTWVKQYRAYLRKRLIMPDGKLASFRWGLSPEVENVSQ